jgi:hypothetical protein
MAVVLAGCIPSLHAVYSGKDVVFDPQLVGVWGPENQEKGSWEFTKQGDKSYRFVCTERDGEKGNFTAHLTRFHDMTFLDIAPDKDQIDSSEFHQAYLLPMHTFFRVEELSSSSLKLSVLKLDGLMQYLRENPDAVKHEEMNGGILLTARTEDLQAFLSSPEVQRLFTKPAELVRRDPDTPQDDQ